MIKNLAVAFVFFVGSIAFAGQALNMKPGLWEITSTTEMAGMPIKIPPQTHTQCLTQKDLVPQNTQPGQQCKITDTKVSGNTVSWSMQCSGQGAEMKGSGTVTYSGTSFKGTVRMSVPQSKMEIVSRMSGKRLGDCK